MTDGSVEWMTAMTDGSISNLEEWRTDGSIANLEEWMTDGSISFQSYGNSQVNGSYKCK